jgi:predicted metal-binding membrane protein
MTLQLRRFVWRHPEWWMLSVAATCWVSEIAGGAHSAHGAGYVAQAGSWAVMVAAMMFPLVVVPARGVAFASLWRRRNRAIAEYLSGYLAVWLLIGVAYLYLAEAFPQLYSGTAGAGWLLLAAVWQLAPIRLRAVRACHARLALAPSGVRADLDCLKFGLWHGCNCVVSCWALMFVAMTGAHNAAWMGVVSAFCAIERYRFRPAHRAIAAVLLLAAVVFLIHP